MEEGEGERISLPRKDIRSPSFDNVRSHSFDSGLRDSLLQGNDDDDFATLSNESNRSWSQRLSYVKKNKAKLFTYAHSSVTLEPQVQLDDDTAHRHVHT